MRRSLLMEFLLAIIVGVVLYAVLRASRISQARATTREPEEPVATIQDPSARFQTLGAALASAGESSSHPRDLASNETFREAVALLKSTDMPLRVVTDYATGAN